MDTYLLGDEWCEAMFMGHGYKMMTMEYTSSRDQYNDTWVSPFTVCDSCVTRHLISFLFSTSPTARNVHRTPSGPIGSHIVNRAHTCVHD